MLFLGIVVRRREAQPLDEKNPTRFKNLFFSSKFLFSVRKIYNKVLWLGAPMGGAPKPRHVGLRSVETPKNAGGPNPEKSDGPEMVRLRRVVLQRVGDHNVAFFSLEVVTGRVGGLKGEGWRQKGGETPQVRAVFPFPAPTFAVLFPLLESVHGIWWCAKRRCTSDMHMSSSLDLLVGFHKVGFESPNVHFLRAPAFKHHRNSKRRCREKENRRKTE